MPDILCRAALFEATRRDLETPPLVEVGELRVSTRWRPFCHEVSTLARKYYSLLNP